MEDKFYERTIEEFKIKKKLKRKYNFLTIAIPMIIELVIFVIAIYLAFGTSGKVSNLLGILLLNDIIVFGSLYAIIITTFNDKIEN
ncbi:hypothetical protein [Mycobacterium sp.]|uniref:hypothetical protein n=1 Tax=Mycobacterium sp. TaxID=1785 RepID=UPI003A8A385E